MFPHRAPCARGLTNVMAGLARTCSGYPGIHEALGLASPDHSPVMPGLVPGIFFRQTRQSGRSRGCRNESPAMTRWGRGRGEERHQPQINSEAGFAGIKWDKWDSTRQAERWSPLSWPHDSPFRTSWRDLRPSAAPRAPHLGPGSRVPPRSRAPYKNRTPRALRGRKNMAARLHERSPAPNTVVLAGEERARCPGSPPRHAMPLFARECGSKQCQTTTDAKKKYVHCPDNRDMLLADTPRGFLV